MINFHSLLAVPSSMCVGIYYPITFFVHSLAMPSILLSTPKPRAR